MVGHDSSLEAARAHLAQAIAELNERYAEVRRSLASSEHEALQRWITSAQIAIHRLRFAVDRLADTGGARSGGPVTGGHPESSF